MDSLNLQVPPTPFCQMFICNVNHSFTFADNHHGERPYDIDLEMPKVRRGICRLTLSLSYGADTVARGQKKGRGGEGKDETDLLIIEEHCKLCILLGDQATTVMREHTCFGSVANSPHESNTHNRSTLQQRRGSRVSTSLAI